LQHFIHFSFHATCFKIRTGWETEHQYIMRWFDRLLWTTQTWNAAEPFCLYSDVFKRVTDLFYLFSLVGRECNSAASAGAAANPRMGTKQGQDDNDRGNNNIRRKPCPSHTLPTTYMIRTFPGLNPKPATILLSVTGCSGFTTDSCQYQHLTKCQIYSFVQRPARQREWPCIPKRHMQLNIECM
jgi:hypothetical protein